MHFSQFVLFEQSPLPFQRSHDNKKPSFRKSVLNKKQITNHLQDQKIGFCLNTLKQKTMLALRDNLKSSRRSSLNKRQLLVSRMGLEIDNDDHFIPAIKKNKPRNFLVSKINVGDLANVPNFPHKRQTNHIMNLTARQSRQFHIFDKPVKLQHENYLRASWMHDKNYSTISTFSPRKTDNQKRYGKKRKFSNSSDNQELW